MHARVHPYWADNGAARVGRAPRKDFLAPARFVPSLFRRAKTRRFVFLRLQLLAARFAVSVSRPFLACFPACFFCKDIASAGFPFSRPLTVAVSMAVIVYGGLFHVAHVGRFLVPVRVWLSLEL